MPKIKNLCAKENRAIFDFYRCGNLYYLVKDVSDEKVYSFNIPLEDTGNATFSAVEKAITLMRWIRKSIENNELTLKS